MKKPLVLFVDDDRLLLDAIKRNLRKQPFEVITEKSAEDAMSYMKRHKVDLVISDDAMKGTPGSEFLCWAAEWFPDVPRIMLTGQPSVPGMQKLINEAGVFKFLTKPVDEVQLTMTVYDALEKSGVVVNQAN